MCCEQKMNSEDLGKKRSKVEKDWVKAKKAYRGLELSKWRYDASDTWLDLHEVWTRYSVVLCPKLTTLRRRNNKLLGKSQDQQVQ